MLVTNGTAAQQERKLRTTGLDRRVDAWVISEALGVSKPDPRIFHAAADLVGASLTGSWMVGDSAAHDIAGAHAVGARSAWLQRGRTWPAHIPRPTLMVETAAEAMSLILDHPTE